MKKESTSTICVLTYVSRLNVSAWTPRPLKMLGKYSSTTTFCMLTDASETSNTRTRRQGRSYPIIQPKEYIRRRRSRVSTHQTYSDLSLLRVLMGGYWWCQITYRLAFLRCKGGPLKSGIPHRHQKILDHTRRSHAIIQRIGNQETLSEHGRAQTCCKPATDRLQSL